MIRFETGSSRLRAPWAGAKKISAFRSFPIFAGLVLGAILPSFGCAPDEPPKELPWRPAALEAARWIRYLEVPGPEGKAWAVTPAEEPEVDASLYRGSSGVALFFLDLYRATGDSQWLDEARAGGRALIATLPDPESAAEEGDGDESGKFRPAEAGLYTGWAGIGFVLEAIHGETGEAPFREGALRAVRLILEHARPEGAGVAWGPSTDMISGTAGIGLFLLHAAKRLDHAESLKGAEGAGLRLLELAETTDSGLRWRLEPDYPKIMPNFSHGTAGVAYFLARLHEETGNPSFLDAARKGGEHLLAIADPSGLIHHHEPDGLGIFYLGWCHGPPGTCRLYQVLARITGEARWTEAIHRAAKAVMESGIPRKMTPGFWNNAGRCCGVAGVGDFFLSLYRESGRKDYLDFARRMGRSILDRARRTESGWCWEQAEHRTRPGLILAQTGWMQGAAGIGAFLLDLERIERGEDAGIVLPDAPF